MDQESITKSILSGIVDRYLIEIAKDPKRSIRKLVDMAERTSDGPTQKICFQMMQQMASNQSSPYYEMIHHLVTHTDPQTVKQFGINLGHNAWTFGSGRIRLLNEKGGAPISWAILADRRPDPQRIAFEEIAGQVEQGLTCDVYAWLLIAGESLEEWEQYRALFRSNSDSVFGLMIDPCAVTEQFAAEAAQIHNLMVILNTEPSGWQEAMKLLSAHQCLVSAYREIGGPEQAEEILSGKWLKELSAFYPLMAFTLAADNCPEDTAEKISKYMWDTRLNQEFPVLPVDLISDFLIISRLVSHQETLCRIETDGRVAEAKGYRFSFAD